MKKSILISSGVFVFIIFIGIFIFTPFGSNLIIKPIINFKIKSEIKKPKIELEKIDLKFNNVNLKAIIENSIDLTLVGKVFYFQKSFDLHYKIYAKYLEIDKEKYNLNLNILGQAKGNFRNFFVNGAGEAFESKINYKFQVEDSLVKKLIANINRANISQILILLKKAPFLNGLVDLNINMPNLDIKNPNGYGNLKIYDAIFNQKEIYKFYKIVIPKDEKLQSNIFAKVYKNRIFVKGDINTTTAKLKIKKLFSSLDFKVIKGYFNLIINDLSRLDTLVKKRLKGSLNLNGVAYLNQKRDIIQAIITTKSLGGLAKIKYLNKKAKIDLKNINITTIENKLDLPKYVTKGNVFAKIYIKNINNFTSDLKLNSTITINKKLLNVTIPNYKYKIDSNINYKNFVIKSKKTNISSSYMRLSLKELKYVIITKRLESSYFLTLNNLASLKNLINFTLRGDLKLYGKVKIKDLNKIYLEANTKSLGGILNTFYNNDLLSLNFKNLSIPKILYILNQPKIVKKGFITGSVKLNSIKKLNGKIEYKANALIDNHLLYKLYNINFGKDIKLYSKSSNLILKNHQLKGDILFKTKGAIFNFYDLVLGLKSGNIKSNYGLDIKDLSIFNTIVNQKLKGSIKILGEFSKIGKYILLSGNSSKFDGTINFLLKGNNFTLNAAGISIIKILDMLNKPKNLDGIAKIDLKYNIKSKIGNFNIIIDNAKFLNSKLVYNLKTYANFDLSQELFQKILIDGNINKNIVIFNLATKSRKVQINIYKGKIDIKSNTIYAKIKVHFNGNDYNFIVKGSLDNPSYKISYSGIIKEKVNKKLKKEIEKLGLDKKVKKIIPNEIKNIDKALPTDIKKDAKKLLQGLFK